jgi:hypothetical protein
MRLRLVATNAVVLAGIVWAVGFSSEIRPKNLLPTPAAPAGTTQVDIAGLESSASLAPSVNSVAALASAYLDRGQPGLASAVIERAPREVREDVRIAELHARALFHRGKPRQALAAVRDALDACHAQEGRCRPWQSAKAARQVAFLEEVVSAGIEDPQADPAAVRAAYERSTTRGEGGLVAMR